jgi:tetratricopeptide (TPR) repeat protein
VILQPAGIGGKAETALSAERDRAEASRLWEILQACTAEDRRMLIEELEEFQTWAVMERVARESIDAAPNHPEEALKLAELALAIAERVPGEVAWRDRLQGYAWAHVGNALRVSDDLPGADQALERAWQLWEAGAAGDPGLLEPAWLPWLDGALRKAQRRFPEALRRLEAALATDPGELRGRIHLTNSGIHDALGQPELSTAALHEAARWINAETEPRFAFGLHFNLLRDLCQLDRFEEANLKIPEIRKLAQRLGEELDLARVAWLEGKIASGLEREAEAENAFREAQQVFSRRELTYDYALVSLDLAGLWLGQNRTADVKALAEEMLAIFRAQKVGREALAALKMFCDAARREAATVELARRVHAEVERVWRA